MYWKALIEHAESTYAHSIPRMDKSIAHISKKDYIRFNLSKYFDIKFPFSFGQIVFFDQITHPVWEMGHKNKSIDYVLYFLLLCKADIPIEGKYMYQSQWAKH